MKVLSKKELMRQMKRFVADKDRGISMALFAQLCGLTPDKMWTIFITETEPLSEYMQLRVNKAFTEWREGNVRVMRDGHKKYVDYRRQAIPPLMPRTRLNLTAEGIKIKVGMVNRHDYSELDLNEALRG
jgi:hypothetical protein